MKARARHHPATATHVRSLLADPHLNERPTSRTSCAASCAPVNACTNGSNARFIDSRYFPATQWKNSPPNTTPHSKGLTQIRRAILPCRTGHRGVIFQSMTKELGGSELSTGEVCSTQALRATKSPGPCRAQYTQMLTKQQLRIACLLRVT